MPLHVAAAASGKLRPGAGSGGSRIKWEPDQVGAEQIDLEAALTNELVTSSSGNSGTALLEVAAW